MHRRWSVFAAVSAAAVVLAAALTVLENAPGHAQGAPIRIGLSTDLSGPNALPGDGDRKGAQLAVEEINAAGGIAGRNVELFVADHRSSPAEAISAIRKLVDIDKVEVIQGSGDSGTTLSGMSVLKEVGVAQVTARATNVRISEQAGKGGNPWMFRVNIDDSMIAEAYARFIADKVKTVALTAYNDDWGRGFVQALTPHLQKRGTKIVATEYFGYGQADFRPLITRVRNAKPEGVVVLILIQDSLNYVRQMREVGLAATVFGRGQLLNTQLLNAYKDNPAAIEGFHDATIWGTGIDPAFEKKYQERWGQVAELAAAMSYYTVRHVFAEALRMAARDPAGINRKTVRDALEKVRAKTPVGDVEFDAHHQAHTDLLITRVQNGAITVVQRVPSAPR
jgi:branched-chain amino acid transport system substrate-binding protein